MTTVAQNTDSTGEKQGGQSDAELTAEVAVPGVADVSSVPPQAAAPVAAVPEMVRFAEAKGPELLPPPPQAVNTKVNKKGTMSLFIVPIVD